MSILFVVKLILVILAISLVIKGFIYCVTAVVKKSTELSSPEGCKVLSEKLKQISSAFFSRSNRVAKRTSRDAIEMAFPKPASVTTDIDWSVYDTPTWQRKGVLIHL